MLFLDTLKTKIDLIRAMEPRSLDDFAPLLLLNEDELMKLVARFSKEKHEIKQKNRIYFLSEKLKVIALCQKIKVFGARFM